MVRSVTIAAACAALLFMACAGAGSQTGPVPVDASRVLSEAAAAMGAENLQSITYSGSAWAARNSFMQTPSASPPWPGNDISNYQRAIDLTRPASRATGETFAPGMFLGPAVAGTYTQNIAADQTAWAQQLEIWLTPWGFLRGAELNGAEATSYQDDEHPHTVVTWRSPETQTSPSGMRYTVNGYINGENLIERVETWVEDPIMGDMHVVALHSDYREFGGVMVPTRMVQERGGGKVFEVTVASATPNPADLTARLTPPAPAGGGPGRGGAPGGAPPAGRGGGAAPAAAAAPTELAQKIADGVYLITGGYVALVTEFSDHVAVFEGGQSEARGQQIIDEVKRVIPGKPIRYVINSHPHSDHSSGLAPFIREGATLVTHRNNVDFFRMAFSTPRTLLGQPTMTPQIEGVDGLRVLEDGGMRLELHHIPNEHSDGTLVAFVPSAKVLFQADFTLPQPGQSPNPFVVSLAENVDKLGLDFERYLAVHAAAQPQSKNDLMAALKR